MSQDFLSPQEVDALLRGATRDDSDTLYDFYVENSITIKGIHINSVSISEQKVIDWLRETFTENDDFAIDTSRSVYGARVNITDEVLTLMNMKFKGMNYT